MCRSNTHDLQRYDREEHRYVSTIGHRNTKTYTNRIRRPRTGSPNHHSMPHMSRLSYRLPHMKHLLERDRELPGYTGDLLEPSRLGVKEPVRHRGRSGRQTRRLRLHRVVVHCLVDKDHLVARTSGCTETYRYRACHKSTRWRDQLRWNIQYRNNIPTNIRRRPKGIRWSCST